MSYFDDKFFAFNHPVGITKSDDGRVYPIVYMPRKCEATELVDDPIPSEEVKEFCNRSIKLLQNAIRLFEEFRDEKRDMVYYWDAPVKCESD